MYIVNITMYIMMYLQCTTNVHAMYNNTNVYCMYIVNFLSSKRSPRASVTAPRHLVEAFTWQALKLADAIYSNYG